MGKLTYLITMLVFAGIPLLLEFLTIRDRMRPYRRWLIGFALFALVGTATDAIAVHWKAWGYNPAHTLDVRILGAELETYIFSVATGVAVVAATFVIAQYESEGKPILKTVFGNLGKRHKWLLYNRKHKGKADVYEKDRP